MHKHTLTLNRRAAAALALAAITTTTTACVGNDDQPLLTYGVPLQQGAYWPKFRRTAANRGYSPLLPGSGQSEVWSFATGKGIFSSPVIDREGTIYLGSADAHFHAIGADGELRWKRRFGELVDSAAAIGADGTIYVGSGDGHLYALEPQTGEVRWTFEPRGGAFITWFEGNVAIGPDGTLYAGNDDFRMYAVDPRSGEERWSYEVTDQIWSAAAFDLGGGEDGDKGQANATDAPGATMYFGSNDLSLHAIDLDSVSGKEAEAKWSSQTLGSVVSSPLVTPSGRVIVGSFDGFVYCFDRGGEQLWTLPTREHIYASAAQGADGTIYLPSADGTLYAFDEEGAVAWTFDILDPIRSSPAIGGDGTIYFGAGDGRLYAINPDGTRRWSFETTAGDSDRNDLNASPALGRDAVYIAGEDGKLWSVPYDHCLRAADDPRCNTDPGEDLAADGVELFFLTPGGSSLRELQRPLGVAEAIAVRLVVREAGDTIDAAIDPTSLRVSLSPAADHDVSVSADGSFLLVVPAVPLRFDTPYELRVDGDYLVGGTRLGAQVSGGRVGGSFDRTMTLRTARRGSDLPLEIAEDRVPVLDLQRLAAPQPTLLPSYNQIGFDFMHLLVGLIELDEHTGRALAWVVAARTDEQGEQLSVDTTDAQRIRFPLFGRVVGDSFVLDSASFRVEFASVEVPMDRLRLGGTLTAASEADRLSIFGESICGDIEYYGGLLRLAGLCNPETDKLVINGTAMLRPASVGGDRPAGLTVETSALVEATDEAEGKVSVTLGGALPDAAQHLVSILLIDANTRAPLPLSYAQKTTQVLDDQGRVTAVEIAFDADAGVEPGRVEAVVIHDLFPVAREYL